MGEGALEEGGEEEVEEGMGGEEGMHFKIQRSRRV